MATDGSGNTSTRPTNVRWFVFGLACASSWLLYLHRYSWGAIRPEFKKDFPEFSDVEMGWLDSAFLITYGAGQIPSGIAGDVLGPRVVLCLTAFFWPIALLGVAILAGFWPLFAARAGFGLAQSGAYPILSKVTRVWFPLSSRTSVQGLVTALGRIGGATGPFLILTVLMGWLALSWQAALIVATAPGIVLAIAVWVIVRNRPSEHPAVNEAEKELIEDADSSGQVSTATAAQGESETGTPKEPLLMLTPMSVLSFVMMLLYIFASTFQDQFYVNLLPSFLREDKGFSTALTGIFAPLALIGGAIGGIFGGFLNDYLIRRTGNRRWSRTGVAFTGKFVAACMVLLSLQFEDGRVVMAVLVGARVFNDWSLSTQWGAVTDMGGRAAATLFGIVNTAGAIGGVAAGPIFGYLKQEYGYDGIFYGVAFMCTIAALTWLFIDCEKKLVRD